MLDALADDIEFALQSQTRQSVAGADEQLLEFGLRRLRAVAKRAVVARDIAPAEERLPFLGDDAGKDLLDGVTIALVVRQEDQTGAVRTDGGQREWHHRTQERIGHLDQNAGAVTRVRLTSARA